MTDRRKSRIPKLKSYSATQLLLAARERLFASEFSTEWSYITLKFLKAASEKGCEESKWLLKVEECFWEESDYIESTLHVDPRSRYYYGRLRGDLGAVRKAAEAGVASAMSFLVQKSDNRSEKLTWATKASELGDPDAFYVLSRIEPIDKASFLLRGASLGSFNCMTSIIYGGYGISPVLAALYGARLSILTGSSDELSGVIPSSFYRFSEGEATSEDLQIMFAVGSEMEGYEQIYSCMEIRLDVSLKCIKCINFYLDITHKARRAALALVSTLRELGVARDVAKIIGRKVYETRKDVVVWYSKPKLWWQP